MSDLQIPIEELLPRFPRPLDTFEQDRAAELLSDAIDEVTDAITDAGHNPTMWLVRPRNARRARRVVRAMVAQAILIGEDIGRQSWSEASGPFSEQVTYRGSIPAPDLWGEVELTDKMKTYLGLTSGGPRWKFPRPWSDAEVPAWRP